MESSQTTRALLAGVLIAAVGAWFANPLAVSAQTKPAAKAQPASKPQSGPAKTPVVAERPPREVTMTGRVVSLHAFMTGEFASPDPAKGTADAIRAGAPAALETPVGLVLLGQGTGGAGKTLIPLAFQNVEVQGKLYEKGGMKYLNITSVKAVDKEEGDDDGDEGDGE